MVHEVRHEIQLKIRREDLKFKFSFKNGNSNTREVKILNVRYLVHDLSKNFRGLLARVEFFK